MMKRALAIAAIGEIATGAALLIVPSLAGQLLLGEEMTGVAVPVARVAGIALVALGIACWRNSPLAGMLIYSVVVMLYLAYRAASPASCCGRRWRYTRSSQCFSVVIGSAGQDRARGLRAPLRGGLGLRP